LPFSELFQSFYIRLCPQSHLGCKFGETPTSGLQDIVFANASYTITDI